MRKVIALVMSLAIACAVVSTATASSPDSHEVAMTKNELVNC